MRRSRNAGSAVCSDIDHTEVVAVEAARNFGLDRRHRLIDSDSADALLHSVEDPRDLQTPALALLAVEAEADYQTVDGSGWRVVPANSTHHWASVATAAELRTAESVADEIAGSEVEVVGIAAVGAAHMVVAEEGVGEIEEVFEVAGSLVEAGKGVALASACSSAPFAELG